MSPKRNPDDVRRDGLLEDKLGCRFHEQKRYRAMELALCSLPDDDYQKLLAKRQSFVWWVPRGNAYACVMPVRSERMLYLSPVLELMPLTLARFAVLHEIAHIVLGHEGGSDAQKEGEVDDKLREWGFGDQVDAARADEVAFCGS